MKKAIVTIASLVILLLLGVGSWYLISPLFIDVNINEDLTELIENDKIPMHKMEKVMEEFEKLAPNEVEAIPTETRAVIQNNLKMMADKMPDKEIKDEPMEDTKDKQPTLVVTHEATFVGADDFHKGSGTARIYSADEKRVLRLENFSVTNGPGLRVYLTRATNGDITKGFKSLGKLKGNKGNQNYEIPNDVNIDEFKSVLIYCEPFKVKFAIADFE